MRVAPRWIVLLALPLVAASEDAPPAPSDGLTGRQIYECVLENRFESFEQQAKLVSGDRGEGAQESRLRMLWKSFRDPEDQPKGGVASKTIVRYEHPFDLRYSGYLVINNVDRANDQFVYLASSRKIRRVNLRKEAVFGTDFSFEDIVPPEVEDADYERLSDAALEGVPMYVVEVRPKPDANSEYSRFVVYVAKDTCVPLRTRYWDEKEIEIKELTVDPASVREFDGVHYPMELTMRNLKLETFTTLTVQELEPNAKLPDRHFDVRRLMSH